MKTSSDLGVLTRILRSAVRGYQRVVDGRPTPCRFVPTCSNYALDALESHGAIRGSVLTVGRLCRCHPWGGTGLDPVPGPSDRPHPFHGSRGSTCST
ncbi:MAG TPA: membrane protein insertion efficiency factor YidD [Acidimicrobiales bacterium]|nr:membrane protein insertion efficiency factor YidD [Actinomycetes bacterium]HCW00886.1 membrane protein insertion efficiency factor YidD [Acidimicrobiaceae bacterium]HJM73404.1 membrane protein insertion efficiency factor YidD [Acidimicrobiales bacterium]